MRKLSLILLTIVGVASVQAGETYHGSHGTYQRSGGNYHGGGSRYYHGGGNRYYSGGGNRYWQGGYWHGQYYNRGYYNQGYGPFFGWTPIPIPIPVPGY
jgi:hypothetical protein